MTSQPGKLTIARRILPNISRTKSNQTINFGQLIEYNMKNNFPETSYTKYVGETIARLFYKKSKLNISLDRQSKVLNIFFIVSQIEGIRDVLKLTCRPLASTKNKERCGTSLRIMFKEYYYF